MDRLEVMRLFTRIVERHSFTLAAQDLELPRSTATQVIRQLEARLSRRSSMAAAARLHARQ